MKLFSVPLALLLLLAPLFTFAQGAEPTVPPLSGTLCSEFYRFGSVEAYFNGELSSVSTGGMLALEGVVTNTNTYPLPDLGVLVKVFRTREGGEKNIYGPDVVDEFFITENLTLRGGESTKIPFTWKVPANIDPGSYQVVGYVVQNRTFNYQGLSFTDDVVGGFYNFTVVGESAGTVSFDKPAVMINGLPHRFVAAPPRISSEIKDFPIEAGLINTAPVPKTVSVTWTLYGWDGLREDRKLDEVEREVTVAPFGTSTVTYMVPENDSYTVQYAVGEIKDGEARSFVHVRFSRTGIERARLNSLGVSSYPISHSEPTQLFACAHNTGTGSDASDTRLEVTINRLGLMGILGPVGTLEFSGPLSFRVTGFKEMIKPWLPLSEFTLDARLYQGDKLVDQTSLTYSCAALGETPLSCNIPMLIVLGIVAVLLVLVFILFWIMNRIRARIRRLTIHEPVV